MNCVFCKRTIDLINESDVYNFYKCYDCKVEYWTLLDGTLFEYSFVFGPLRCLFFPTDCHGLGKFLLHRYGDSTYCLKLSYIPDITPARLEALKAFL
jgi:hypothetical protein